MPDPESFNEPQALLELADQRTIVAIPGMKAGAVEAQVRQEDPAHHAGFEAEIGEHAPPGAGRVEAVLAKEVGHALEVRVPELQADQQHHMTAQSPAPER